MVTFTADIASPSATGSGTSPFANVQITDPTGGNLQGFTITASDGSFGSPPATGSAPATYTINGETWYQGGGTDPQGQQISVWANEDYTAGFLVRGFGTSSLTVEPDNLTFGGRTLYITEAIAESFIDQIVLLGFESTSRTFSGTITDIGGGSGTASFTYPNDAPTLNGTPTDITVTEDVASNVDLSAIFVADGDADPLTMTITASAGTLAATSGGSVTVEGGGTGTLTLSGSDTALNSFLNTASNIKYTGASNANGNNAATLTISLSDGIASPVTRTVNIDITAVNDAPVLSSVIPGAGFVENGAAFTLAPGGTIRTSNSTPPTITPAPDWSSRAAAAPIRTMFSR